MTVTGYASDRALVDADWAQAHLTDPKVRFVEVDVDTTAYSQGHIPGAVGWDWTSQLSDGVRRDIASREDFSDLLSKSGIGPGHDDRPVRRQQQLVRGLGLLAAQAVRPQRRPDPQRRSQVLARQRAAAHRRRAEPRRNRLPAAASADDALRAYPRRHPAAARRGGARPRRRPLAGRVQRRDHRSARHDRDRSASRPHPRRRVDPVGPDRPRGWHVQEPPTSSRRCTRRRASRPTRT